MGVPVLIVDDDRLLCGIFVRQLTALGHDAFRAENGEEAVELARHHDFAAIFIDYELPNECGVAVAQRLGALQPRATMVMTSGWHPPTVAEALAAGRVVNCRLLSKPWALDDVMGILGEASARYAPPSATPAAS